MGQASLAQETSPPGSAQDLVKQGQKLNSEGKQDEALKLYGQALAKSPNSYEAHLESGIALDLKGDYTAAREHLQRAINVAPLDKKNTALRVMAFSYAFEKNGAEAEKYEKQTEEIQGEAKKLEAETDLERRRADRFDLGEVFLEIGLVITSITLLSGRRIFWHAGILLGVAGMVAAATSLLVK